jgi:hypothetical protein
MLADKKKRAEKILAAQAELEAEAKAAAAAKAKAQADAEDKRKAEGARIRASRPEAAFGRRRLLLRRQPPGAGGTRRRRLHRAGAGQTRERGRRRRRAHAAMREKIKAGRRESPYRLRKQLPRPVFAQIKQPHGFPPIPVARVEKVDAEAGVVRVAHNILKLAQGRTPSLAHSAVA